jgi:hypothetical protein
MAAVQPFEHRAPALLATEERWRPRSRRIGYCVICHASVLAEDEHETLGGSIAHVECAPHAH